MHVDLIGVTKEGGHEILSLRVSARTLVSLGPPRPGRCLVSAALLTQCSTPCAASPYSHASVASQCRRIKKRISSPSYLGKRPWPELVSSHRYSRAYLRPCRYRPLFVVCAWGTTQQRCPPRLFVYSCRYRSLLVVCVWGPPRSQGAHPGCLCTYSGLISYTLADNVDR
jgi:hypothetical protein